MFLYFHYNVRRILKILFSEWKINRLATYYVGLTIGFKVKDINFKQTWNNNSGSTLTFERERLRTKKMYYPSKKKTVKASTELRKKNLISNKSPVYSNGRENDFLASQIEPSAPFFIFFTI